MQPNIYECKICHEHHCDHDYQLQEEDIHLFPITLQPAPLPKKLSQTQLGNGQADKNDNNNEILNAATSSKSHDDKN